MRILHIDSSITGAASVSRLLSAETLDTLRQAHPEAKVEYLDLGNNPPPHLGPQSLGMRTGQAATTEQERKENAISETLVTQFLAADMIVLGAPFYNFTISTQLKAWFDRIAQAGRTFTYTAAGPQGLATGKKVYVLSARGGIYSSSAAGQALEHQESYLKVIFGFMGVTDITFIHAEGLAMGEEAKRQAIAHAQQSIAQLAPEVVAA